MWHLLCKSPAAAGVWTRVCLAQWPSTTAHFSREPLLSRDATAARRFVARRAELIRPPRLCPHRAHIKYSAYLDLFFRSALVYSGRLQLEPDDPSNIDALTQGSLTFEFESTFERPVLGQSLLTSSEIDEAVMGDSDSWSVVLFIERSDGQFVLLDEFNHIHTAEDLDSGFDVKFCGFSGPQTDTPVPVLPAFEPHDMDTGEFRLAIDFNNSALDPGNPSNSTDIDANAFDDEPGMDRRPRHVPYAVLQIFCEAWEDQEEQDLAGLLQGLFTMRKPLGGTHQHFVTFGPFVDDQHEADVDQN
jgi:hypothetical protein